jgi:hypothetical protein
MTMFLNLEFVHWDLPAGAERLGFALEQILAGSLRVQAVARRLQEIAARSLDHASIDVVVDDLQYHGEAFLTAIYELRNRLVFLEAVITGHEDELLHDRTFDWGYRKRERVLLQRIRDSPQATREVAALRELEDLVCKPVQHRGKMTHESFFSLGIVYYLEGQSFSDAGATAGSGGQVIHDIADFLRVSRADSDLYARITEALAAAVARFGAQRMRDAERMHDCVLRVIESASRTGQLG